MAAPGKYVAIRVGSYGNAMYLFGISTPGSGVAKPDSVTGDLNDTPDCQPPLV